MLCTGRLRPFCRLRKPVTGSERRVCRPSPRRRRPNLSRNVVLPNGAAALARPVCVGPDGTSAVWPVPRGGGAPGTAGGGGAAGAPPLTRLAACHWGILWPGFSNSMPGSKRVQRGFPMFSGESIILPEGCRERRLRALPRQSRPAGRSSLPPSARRAAPRQGANRVTPGRPRGIRGIPPPFLPAWRFSARSDVLARYQDFGNPG